MKRNKFSLSNTRLLSCNMGSLVPIGWYEALPGDTIQQATSALVRAAPLVSPVMHPVDVRIHHWFVPNRIIWEDWEDFITGGSDGMDNSAFPFRTGTNISVGGLADHLGIPQGNHNPFLFSMLPVRAYNAIWNEFYRDQDLQTEVTNSVASGEDTTSNGGLLNVCWEKDYYTSSRPWEQKGPQITIPLGTTAPVVANGNPPVFRANTTNPTTDRQFILQTSGALGYDGGNVGATDFAKRWGSETGMQVDLSGASAVTVNVFREAMALQRFEEARARYGSRYTEYLRYLGVRSSDARLQRPEYLGGGRQVIQFSEVLQTAPGDDTTQNTVGALKGHGISAVRSNRYRRFFEEHGIVMSLLSVRPKTIYMNGLPRKWNRQTREDYWQKELEHIGQQEVIKQEIYLDSANTTAVFGYQDRYDEYRRQESSVGGEFQTLLDYWHFGRKFASEPSLNADFVSCVPTERTFASNVTDVLYVMARHSIQARRVVARSGKSFIF